MNRSCEVASKTSLPSKKMAHVEHPTALMILEPLIVLALSMSACAWFAFLPSCHFNPFRLSSAPKIAVQPEAPR
jgi:hypothetical protein